VNDLDYCSLIILRYVRYLSNFQGYEDKRKGKIWQLLRAMNFESLMYPCFTFCRILGIFPYKINVLIIEIYKPYCILSIIIICLFCVYELLLFYYINFVKNNLIKNIPIKLERNCYYFLNGFTTIVIFILCGPNMSNAITSNFNGHFLRLPQESYQNLSKLIHAKDIFGFFYIVVQMSIFAYKFQTNIAHYIFATYVHLLVFQMYMLNMNCVCLLKICLFQTNQ